MNSQELRKQIVEIADKFKSARREGERIRLNAEAYKLRITYEKLDGGLADFLRRKIKTHDMSQIVSNWKKRFG